MKVNLKTSAMKQNGLLLFIFVSVFFLGCENDQNNLIKISPLEELKLVDNLLAEIAEKPQLLNAPSDKAMIVTGAKGTVIHVDPDRLETVDESPLGDDIQIELLEMTDKSSMLLNNTQTVSNGQILETGGAYYLNMTSDGKQLKVKQGKGLEVEFPKLSDDEMGLFLGERDSLGQINWVQTNDNFKPKNIDDAQVPEKSVKKRYTKKTYDELDAIFGYIDGDDSSPVKEKEEELTEVEYQAYLKKKIAYEEQQKQIEYQRKTYEAIKIMNFGWINCDRFWKDPNPKTDLQILVNDESFSGARFYAIFRDINSMMTEQYWKGRIDTPTFKNIPVGKELHIIALSAKGETPYVFEKTITTEPNLKVEVNFVASTQAEIKEKMKRMK